MAVRERERLAGLSRSDLFEGLGVEVLAAVATTRALVRGEYLWRAGDRGQELYVVLAGEAQDVVLDADGRQVVHTVHGPGMTVGEPGYFSAERDQSVSNVAVTSATVIRLDRRDLATRSLTDRVLLRLLELVETNPQRLAGLAITPPISQSEVDR